MHVPLGKVSFEHDKLDANFRAVLDELQRAKPAAAKGRYIKKITISSTMGPGVRVDTNRLKPDAELRHPARTARVMRLHIRLLAEDRWSIADG